MRPGVPVGGPDLFLELVSRLILVANTSGAVGSPAEGKATEELADWIRRRWSQTDLDIGLQLATSLRTSLEEIRDETRPREPLEQAEVSARRLGEKIRRSMPRGWGFFLVLSSFGADGFLTYLSSIERASARELVLDLFQRWEKEPSV